MAGEIPWPEPVRARPGHCRGFPGLTSTFAPTVAHGPGRKFQVRTRGASALARQRKTTQCGQRWDWISAVGSGADVKTFA